jgi:hypothetical protein
MMIEMLLTVEEAAAMRDAAIEEIHRLGKGGSYGRSKRVQMLRALADDLAKNVAKHRH